MQRSSSMRFEPKPRTMTRSASLCGPAGGSAEKQRGSQSAWHDDDDESGPALSGYVTPSMSVKRPPQVPRLDLTFIHRNAGIGHKDGLLEKHNWKSVDEKSEKSRMSRTLSTGGLAAAQKESRSSEKRSSERPVPCFSTASPEDQQRIAEFYGYRDESFVATMSGLSTDQIRPSLYLGNMADAAYKPLLKALGITHVLNCAVEAQKAPPPYKSEGVKYLLLPFKDSKEGAENLARQRFQALREATRFIHSVIKGNPSGTLLVHCVQGLARSAALTCAYLMEYEGMAFDKAMTEVKMKHKGCLATAHWQALLKQFNAELLR